MIVIVMVTSDNGSNDDNNCDAMFMTMMLMIL